jgi:predicted CXXCH cytochrome family protein
MAVAGSSGRTVAQGWRFSRPAAVPWTARLPQTLAAHRRPKRRLAAVVLALPLLAILAVAQQEGKILRPIDGAALPTEAVEIIATAPAGRLQLDGQSIEAQQPFPDVFHAKTTVTPGEHRLALIWEGGRNEIRIFVGPNPPAPFKAYLQHPPAQAVECTQCHGVSRRGRFRFEGGCFDCHVEDNFTKTHPHAVHILQECGLCHNAHGSTAQALLLYPTEKACKLCHN